MDWRSQFAISKDRRPLPKQFKVAVPAHARGPQQVRDDEDRHRVVHGNHHGTLDCWLGIDQVIALPDPKL